MSIGQIIGRNIKVARVKKGLIQKELSKLIGKTPNFICYIESGKKIPNLLQAIDISRALDISVGEILKDVEATA